MRKLISLMLTLSLFASVSYSQDAKEDDPMKPALLVIDVQNKYLPMMSQGDQDAALERMKWAIWLFRQHELPVIRIYHTSEKWGPEPGSEEFQFHESLEVQDDDPMIVKTYGSGFNKTALDSLLNVQGINTLFMCGLSSTGCVLATYFDANNYDYNHFLLKDALLGPDAGYTDNIEEMFDAISLQTTKFIIEQAK
ncbi:MAG: isochorismatase family cysteine hydrolase [Bacteroidota bacterium]